MFVEVVAGPEFRVGDPRRLFETNSSDYSNEADISIDGSRMLVQSSEETGEARRVTPYASVVLNWFEALKARRP